MFRDATQWAITCIKYRKEIKKKKNLHQLNTHKSNTL